MEMINNSPEEFAFAIKGLLAAIRDSISNRFYLNIDYSNLYVPSPVIGYRNIAPAALGINRVSGNLVLRAYLIRGISYSIRENISKNQWRLFLVSRISAFGTSSNKFGPLPLYRLNDKGMSIIREQLQFTSDDEYDWFEI